MSRLSVLLLFLALAPAQASDLGRVDFPTSGKPEAQAHFLRGVAALHSFWYDEAADAFREAQKIDPAFAMAYWGEAMTYNHPIWSEKDSEAAKAVLAKAPKAPTEREKEWMAAVGALYEEGDRAYAEAMRALHERRPDDLEAASFYALSLIGPALTGGQTGPDRDRDLIKAAAVLEEFFDRNPEHPGVLHYLIHAYDDPVHAPLGLRAARTYAKVAPSAHHALHMPSHIFVQLGQWPETSASNEAAWAASVDWVKRRGLGLEKRDFHSLSWLAYSYLQLGRLRKAEEVLEIARQAARESDSPRVASSLEGMEARHRIETRTWQPAKVSAAKADEGAHCGMAHPQGDGLGWLAQGLGAVRAGDLAAAEEAAAALRKLNEGKAEDYRSASGRIMEKEVAALVLLARGKQEEALALLKEAAELEARMPPPSGPPDPVKPAPELYGEALLEAGKAEEAARQFEASLLRMPNRAASLLGAARAAAKIGDREAARRHYAALAEVWKDADPTLPDLAEVRAYLSEAPAR
ncbi:MAG TPA: tetratricopeptide repeat protein [Thermoanaerobaculia bacterium]|nr:tetratricopeptide repeat protein [Thermoanaerobaculia bacterium]